MPDGVNLNTSGTGQNQQITGGGDQGGTKTDFSTWLQDMDLWIQTYAKPSGTKTDGVDSTTDTSSTYDLDWVDKWLKNPDEPPYLADPSENAYIPGGPNGMGNPWLSPNPIAVFTMIILELLKIQSEQKRTEALREADLIIKGFETALSRAQALIAKGEAEAAEQYIQAAVSFANAAVALGTGLAGMGSFKKAEADVKAETKRFETNPDFNKLPLNNTSKESANTQRMNQYIAKKNELKNTQTKLDTAKAAKPPDENKIADLEKQIGKLEKEEAAIRPGVKDIEAWESDHPLVGQPGQDRVEMGVNMTQLKADQQATLKDRTTNESKYISERQTQLATLFQALNQGLSALFNAIGNVATAPIKTEIAGLQALIEILQEGSNIIRNAFSSSADAKNAAAEMFTGLIQALERWQAAETQNFGFSGGRAY